MLKLVKVKDLKVGDILISDVNENITKVTIFGFTIVDLFHSDNLTCIELSNYEQWVISSNKDVVIYCE